MNPPYDNLFSFFRGPTGRDTNELGRQLEDNATKSLLNVLDLANREKLSKRVVRTIGEAVGVDDESIRAVPTSKWEFTIQSNPQDIALEDRDIYLYGLSKEGKDPISSEFHLEEDLKREASQDRLDSVIQIGSEITLIGEHKFLDADLNEYQLRKYATLFEIPEEHFGTLRWKSVYDAMAKPAGGFADGFSERITNQYREFLA
jgi:hypothetical protein